MFYSYYISTELQKFPQSLLFTHTPKKKKQIKMKEKAAQLR